MEIGFHARILPHLLGPDTLKIGKLDNSMILLSVVFLQSGET